VVHYSSVVFGPSIRLTGDGGSAALLVGFYRSVQLGQRLDPVRVQVSNVGRCVMSRDIGDTPGAHGIGWSALVGSRISRCSWSPSVGAQLAQLLAQRDDGSRRDWRYVFVPRTFCYQVVMAPAAEVVLAIQLADACDVPSASSTRRGWQSITTKPQGRSSWDTATLGRG
jgi:hypothetical protein